MKMKEEEQETEGQTKIHNVRFYNLTPRSIIGLCYNRINSKLALSRSDGSIEIWDLQYAPFLEKTIPNTSDASIEGIAWCGDRLFTVGLTDEVIEWDLFTLKRRRSHHVTGNSIWCVDINPDGTELAIGTDEGYINILDVSDDKMLYKNLFDKQEGRILCCKFNATGEFLVTGSLGAIRIWNVKSGHAVHKMTVARIEKNKDVIIWSLQVLRDFTIISGDSRGQVSVWDGKTAVLLESHQVLKADVLAVAVNEDENMLICSGIDPIIRIYAKTQIKREDMELRKWVKYLQRNVHDHDVKTLLCIGDKIFSGGMDGYLGISSIAKTRSSIAKYGPFLQGPSATVSPGTKLLLLRYTNYLEIWRLGSTSGKLAFDAGDSSIQNHKLLALKAGPEKLLELKSKHEVAIVCSSLSPDGNWLVYSSQLEIRLFKFVPPLAGQISQLTRVKDLPEQFSAATKVVFVPDSSRLFLVKSNNTIEVFAFLPSGEIDFVQTLDAMKFIKDTIHIAEVSQCGSYFIAAGTCRTISVWAIFQGKTFKHYMNLPRYMAPTTAIAMQHDAPRLVATFSDGKIIEYDLEEMCFTCTDRDYFVNNSETHCINGIVLDPKNPKVFILHNDTYLFVLEKYKASAEENFDNNDDSSGIKKSLKKTKLIVDTKVSGLRLKFQKTFEHFIYLSRIGRDELVAIGVNPISLIDKLPGALKQKKFGSS